jgi:alpha-L-fucosidase
MTNQDRDPLAWWREARFGMFIHWGIYSVPAGIWKGQPVPSLGEWIMHNAKIPYEEYSQLAKQFNPIKFSAKEWVSLAAQAGMKYLVITAKHHDGFAMFDSSNPYNIVDATPYGHDVMRDLADACGKYGLQMCFYYSQDQDWAEPGASGHWEEVADKGWHGHKPDPEAFAAYLERKVKPQLRELLTNYGPIGLIWFDTPVAITLEQSLDLKSYVHGLQPDCLVSGRVGNDVGDYGSLGDNQIPAGPVEGDWETPATLNDTWGYKSDDHNWKSLKDLLTLLVDLTSKGVNYLLNVGPTSEGLFPQPSVDLLKGMGKWMDVNSAAIHGASPNPWPYEFGWGRVTTKGNKLYLLLTEWTDELKLFGLRNKVVQAFPLGGGKGVKFRQEADVVHIGLPENAPDPLISVICVEFEGELDVDPSIAQQLDGSVSLPAYLADLEGDMTLDRAKNISGWKLPEGSLKWQFKLHEPGKFAVRVVIGTHYHSPDAAAGHEVTVTVEGQPVSGALSSAEKVESARSHHFPEYITTIGEVELTEAGTLSMEMTAQKINPNAPAGLMVARVELVRL